jgi:hypothetical protein
MKHINWREIVEILGAVTIVAALLLVALELREGNRISQKNATALQQFALLDSYARLQAVHAASPEYAKLFAKVSMPKGQLFTATDLSQMQTIAWQTVNFYRSAQIAADLGQIPAEQLSMFTADLESTLQRYPGLRGAFLDAYANLGAMQNKAIFRPLAELDERSPPPSNVQ